MAASDQRGASRVAKPRPIPLESARCRGGEMVDAADLKSAVAKVAYGFESRPRHAFPTTLNLGAGLSGLVG